MRTGRRGVEGDGKLVCRRNLQRGVPGLLPDHERSRIFATLYRVSRRVLRQWRDRDRRHGFSAGADLRADAVLLRRRSASLLPSRRVVPERFREPGDRMQRGQRRKLQAVGTRCGRITCPLQPPQPSTQACCLTNATCRDIAADTCATVAGGTPQGAGTRCSGLTCPAYGGCCAAGCHVYVARDACQAAVRHDLRGLPWRQHRLQSEPL